MSFFPKTAVGFIGLMIFVGWLAGQIINVGTEAPITHITNVMTKSQNDIVEITNRLSTSNGIFGFASDVVSIFFNILIMIGGFITILTTSVIMFLSTTFLIPVIISEIFIALLFVGLTFAFVKFLIPDA